MYIKIILLQNGKMGLGKRQQEKLRGGFLERAVRLPLKAKTPHVARWSVSPETLTGKVLWSQHDQQCVSWLINSPLTSEHQASQLLAGRLLESDCFPFFYVQNDNNGLHSILAAYVQLVKAFVFFSVSHIVCYIRRCFQLLMYCFHFILSVTSLQSGNGPISHRYRQRLEY